MNRWAHASGRGLAAAGLCATAGYLSWRIATLAGTVRSGAPVWLVSIALAVELAAFAGSLLLVWALWRRIPPATPTPASTIEPRDVDVVVRVSDQPLHQVRATLLALQSTAAGRTALVDLNARAEIVELATEFDTLYAVPDIADRNGLKTCSAVTSAPALLLLDAGDVPSADAVLVLLPYLNDDSVGVVIAQSVMADEDSAEHGPNGMHELSFERERLNPALALRGAAVLLESGALIRRAAADSVPAGDEDLGEAEPLWSVAMMAEGWRVIAPLARPVLVRPVVDCQEVVYERRVAQARAARRTVMGRRGVLRTRSFRLGQRLAITAAAVRPLSGLRRAGFIAVLIGCMLAGALPLHADALVLATLWAQGWLWTSVGLALMSGWVLRPGDRTRASLRNLGASWQGMRHPLAFEGRRAPVMTPHALQHGGALVISVVLTSAVIVMRGLSEQWTHALGVMPYRHLAGLVAVALWSLAMSLDVLRMMGRRAQLRRAARIVASIPAEVDSRPVAVQDITPLGVGFDTSVELAVKQELTMNAAITTRRGCEDVMLPLCVRHVHPMGDDRWRVGAEFTGATAQSINTLVELCVVEPARRRLTNAGAVDLPVQVPEVVEPVLDGRRLPLRLIALLAVLGAIASAQPGDGTPLAWIVSSLSILIAAGVMAGSARPRRPGPVRSDADDQSTSSPSPDLAIR